MSVQSYLCRGKYKCLRWRIRANLLESWHQFFLRVKIQTLKHLGVKTEWLAVFRINDSFVYFRENHWNLWEYSFVIDQMEFLGIGYFNNFGNFNVNNLVLVIINISISNIWTDNWIMYRHTLLPKAFISFQLMIEYSWYFWGLNAIRRLLIEICTVVKQDQILFWLL